MVIMLLAKVVKMSWFDLTDV